MNKDKKDKNNIKVATSEDISGKAIKTKLPPIKEEDSYQQKKSDSSKKKKGKVSNEKKDDLSQKKKENLSEEIEKVSEQIKEISSEKSFQTRVVSTEEKSEETNLFKFSRFDINPFIEEESKGVKETKTPRNFDMYSSNSEEGTHSQDELFAVTRIRESIQDMNKGYMINLRMADYFDLVEKYSKAAQKIISETIENCTCNETTIPKYTP
jgi:hypothetical protein